MYDIKYIQENINTIFSVECDKLKQNSSFHYIEKFQQPKSKSSSFAPVYHAGAVRELKRDLNLDLTHDFYLEWDTYKTLKQLYNKIEIHPASRKLFIDLIKEKLLNPHYFIHEIKDYTSPQPLYFEQHDISSLAFYFLLKIGKSKDIIEIIDNAGKNNFEGLFHDIYIFIHNEPLHFDEELLNALEKLNSINDYTIKINFKEEFKRKINSIKYHNLQKELLETNEEINIDKEKVIEFISKYGFPQEMEEFLLEIDNLSELAEWKSISSGMIGNLRTFHDKLIENIAKQINSKTGIDYPTDGKNIRENYRIYIKQILKLSNNDNKLIKSFTDILNKEGSHAFLSEIKYFKLTKNINIEISLFLFSKLDEFLQE